MEKKGEWVRIKLREIISNPAYLGRTVRLGNNIFEVKGVDDGRRIRGKERRNRRKNTAADFTATS